MGILFWIVMLAANIYFLVLSIKKEEAFWIFLHSALIGYMVSSVIMGTW